MTDETTSPAPAPTKGKRHVSTGTRNTFSMKEDYALTNLILTEYTSSGLGDTEFAEYASTKITLRPGVTIKDSNILNRRREFGIAWNAPANATRGRSKGENGATILALQHTVADLSERVMMLEGWINVTFPNKGPKKVI